MLFLYREPYSVSALTTIAARITEHRPSSFEAIIPVYKTRAALEDLGSWINAFVVSPYQSFCTSHEFFLLHFVEPEISQLSKKVLLLIIKTTGQNLSA